MPITRIVNANVPDGLELKKDDRSAFVGSPGDITSSSRPDVIIDGTGCTVIPGLIDSKVDTGASECALPMYVAHGATTAIDSSSSSEESQAMRTAAMHNPTLPSYHASGSAVGPENITLVSMFNYSGVQTVATPDEARKLIHSNIVSNQADFIKIIVDQPGLSMDVIAAAVSETHSHGKVAVAQSSQVASYKLAVDVGCDVLSPVPVDGELDGELIRRIVDNRIGIIPTLCFLERALPLWKESHPEYDFSHALAAVTALDAAGARICAGSSSNNWSNFSLPFGRGLHDELRLLASAGISNSKLIQAVTSEPASLFKLHDRGLIQPGRTADLILVEGNPLHDIEALSKIRSVWVAGVQRGK
ncbi:hypothetical protein E4U41_004338 [Claviceps citrina]|nr:hypothetical protein E4U41_004338 [Claviceps citrina]